MYSRELTTFLAVAEHGSFLKASKELYITPASVMNQINKLESLVGVQLIVRTNQGTQLTAAGRSLYKDAKKIIRQSEQAIARARQIAKDEQQAIRVGTSILRPCKTLVDLWSRIDDGTLPVTLHIVPSTIAPPAWKSCWIPGQRNRLLCGALRFSHMERTIQYPPAGNRFTAALRFHGNIHYPRRKCSGWSDLDGETMMVVKRGDSPGVKSIAG